MLGDTEAGCQYDVFIFLLTSCHMAADDQDREGAGEKPHTGSINLPLCSSFTLILTCSFNLKHPEPVLHLFSISTFIAFLPQTNVCHGRIIGDQNNLSTMFDIGNNSSVLFLFCFLVFLPYAIVRSTEKDPEKFHFRPLPGHHMHQLSQRDIH